MAAPLAVPASTRAEDLLKKFAVDSKFGTDKNLGKAICYFLRTYQLSEIRRLVAYITDLSEDRTKSFQKMFINLSDEECSILTSPNVLEMVKHFQRYCELAKAREIYLFTLLKQPIETEVQKLFESNELLLPGDPFLFLRKGDAEVYQKLVAHKFCGKEFIEYLNMNSMAWVRLRLFFDNTEKCFRVSSVKDIIANIMYGYETPKYLPMPTGEPWHWFNHFEILYNLDDIALKTSVGFFSDYPNRDIETKDNKRLANLGYSNIYEEARTFRELLRKVQLEYNEPSTRVVTASTTVDMGTAVLLNALGFRDKGKIVREDYRKAIPLDTLDDTKHGEVTPRSDIAAAVKELDTGAGVGKGI